MGVMYDDRVWAPYRLIMDDLRTQALENDIENGILSKQFSLSIEEVWTLRESFEYCDVDGSGYIDHEELNITLFLGTAQVVLMQIICECPVAQFTAVLPTFHAIVKSLHFAKKGYMIVSLVGRTAIGSCISLSPLFVTHATSGANPSR